MLFNIKILFWGGLLLLVSSCSPLSFLVFIKPPGPFNDSKVPTAPNYSLSKNWHKWRMRDTSKRVDVFYVHPTTYITGNNWNQDLENDHVNWRTRVLPINYQARVFYEDCRMFIPKYRQAIFYSFADKKEHGKQALEVAYEDVRAAFYTYWKTHNKNRPFIIAAHSQGAYHSQRLLAEILEDSTIRSKLVVGYILGWPITETYLKQHPVIEVCSTARQTACIVSWNTEGKSPNLSLVQEVGQGQPVVCINPLSWTTDTVALPKTKNLGALQYNKATKEDEIILYYCGAQIKNGALKINPPANQKQLQMPMGKGNYHLYDYNFFYQNIKQNIKDRIDSYYQQREAAQSYRMPN